MYQAKIDLFLLLLYIGLVYYIIEITTPKTKKEKR